MKYLIGVDLGTSATKTVLFDEAGQVITSAAQEYPLLQPENGWAEQDPHDWRDATTATIRAVVKTSGVAAADIKGIGISGQMHGLVMLDEKDEVIRPSIIWCDQRTGEECKEITERVGLDRLMAITANPALTGFTASKILWVRNHEPKNYARCRHILLPKDYVRFTMTGVFATDVSDASGMQLLDIPKRAWSQEVLDKLDIPREWLPEVYESPEVTGHLTKAFAEATGLTEETVVVGGAGDNAAAAVGTGVVREGRAFTTIGTSGVVFAHMNAPHIDTKGRVHTFCCAVPGAWHVMGVTQAAGLSLRWFRDNLAECYKRREKETGIDAYAFMNHDVAEVPRGSRRLIYLPYLMGERTPHLDPDCRGVFFGLSAIHTKQDMMRAVMEGVSYSLCDCQEILREMQVNTKAMMACGGGARSEVWRQMLADMYGCPVQTIRAKEGPALGAAILAGVGAGVFPDVVTACERLIEPDAVCRPDAAAHAYYEKGHKLYQKLYASLKDSFQDLAAL
ncbi:xylulokinase [uncultured Selenomonas sp.]|uniref:xylulokinase n=1 Tax=uncultured Selenomonas sp. TaxID=159275 RepID=UPI0025F87DBE|nr:xylulokinase [uncultured Selenomonas sp.]